MLQAPAFFIGLHRSFCLYYNNVLPVCLHFHTLFDMHLKYRHMPLPSFVNLVRCCMNQTYENTAASLQSTHNPAVLNMNRLIGQLRDFRIMCNHNNRLLEFLACHLQ